MKQQVETEFLRSLGSWGELVEGSDGSNAAPHTIDKRVVLSDEEWEEFVMDFGRDQDWIPRRKKATVLVECLSSDEKKIVVQNEGYKSAKYVGLVW